MLPAKTNKKDMPNALSLCCFLIIPINHSKIRTKKTTKHTIPNTIANGYRFGYLEYS